MKWKNHLLKKLWKTSQEETMEQTIEEDISNDLKEFGVDSDAPDLFSAETENSSSDDLLSSIHEDEMMILRYQHS